MHIYIYIYVCVCVCVCVLLLLSFLPVLGRGGISVEGYLFVFILFKLFKKRLLKKVKKYFNLKNS